MNEAFEDDNLTSDKTYVFPGFHLDLTPQLPNAINFNDQCLRTVDCFV